MECCVEISSKIIFKIMRQKLTQGFPFVIGAAAFLAQAFARNCISVVCSMKALLVPFAFTVFTPLYWFSLISLFPLLILIFVPKNVFRTWLRFAIPWVILSAILIAITPTYNGGLFPIYSFVTEDMAKLTGGIFAVVTLILIAWKSWAVRKGK